MNFSTIEKLFATSSETGTDTLFTASLDSLQDAFLDGIQGALTDTEDPEDISGYGDRLLCALAYAAGFYERALSLALDRNTKFQTELREVLFKLKEDVERYIATVQEIKKERDFFEGLYNTLNKNYIALSEEYAATRDELVELKRYCNVE